MLVRAEKLTAMYGAATALAGVSCRGAVGATVVSIVGSSWIDRFRVMKSSARTFCSCASLVAERGAGLRVALRLDVVENGDSETCSKTRCVICDRVTASGALRPAARATRTVDARNAALISSIKEPPVEGRK